VTVEASDGTTTVSTVSLTIDDVGFFALRSLPTPGQYTVRFVREGYSSETRTIDLGPDEPEEGLAISLAPRTGSLSGTVRQDHVGAIGGVTVTVSGPDGERSTTTASQGDVGHYTFRDLPAPATYTVSFSKPGLVGQTRLEVLDPQRGQADVEGVDASLIRSTATIRGTVTNFHGRPVAQATVVLTDGTTTRQLLSADEPAGRFEFSGVAPGAYTLSASLPDTSSSVALVDVAAAEVLPVPMALDARASITGTVQHWDAEAKECADTAGWIVRLFVAVDFPAGEEQDHDTTDSSGFFTFSHVDAPEDYVVAVYDPESPLEEVDSRFVSTKPSKPVSPQPPFCTGKP
jgi:hypothetical protein